MTIQEIIDYLSKTPGNTNPAVISTMVEEYAGSGGSSSDVGFVVFTYDPSDQTYSADTNFNELTQYESIIGVLVMGNIPYAAIGELGDDNCWFDFAVLTTPSTYELTYYNDNSIEVEEYWLSGPTKTVTIANGTGSVLKVRTAENGTQTVDVGKQVFIRLRASVTDHIINDFIDCIFLIIPIANIISYFSVF